MSKPYLENAPEPLELRWAFVPMTVALAALAATLIWPVSESVPAGTVPSLDSKHATQSLSGASTPATARQDARPAVQGATPDTQTLEAEHAPTF
jgi:hypothetical protein